MKRMYSIFVQAKPIYFAQMCPQNAGNAALENNFGVAYTSLIENFPYWQYTNFLYFDLNLTTAYTADITFISYV